MTSSHVLSSLDRPSLARRRVDVLQNSILKLTKFKPSFTSRNLARELLIIPVPVSSPYWLHLQDIFHSGVYFQVIYLGSYKFKFHITLILNLAVVLRNA